MVFSVITLALSLGQAEAQKTGKDIITRKQPVTVKADSTAEASFEKRKITTGSQNETSITADTTFYNKNNNNVLITSPGEKVKLTVHKGNESTDIINKKEETVSGISVISKSGEVKMNDNKNPPMYLLDGKEINAEAMKELDANSIKEINVLKGENANKYGEKGKNGVIEIKTKTKETESASKDKNLVKANDKTSPVYYVDGKEVTSEEVNKIVSDKIERINVLKGENATKKYGEKGKNGVVEILLKKPVT